MGWLYGFGDALIFEYGLWKQMPLLPKGGIKIPTRNRPAGICVQVTLNRRQRISMLVDTGCSMCVIDRSLVKELKVPLRFRRTMYTIDNENFGANQAIVPEIKIGELSLQNLPVIVMDLHPLSCRVGHEIDAILGEDVLYHFVATINIRNNLIILKTGNEFKPFTFITMERPVCVSVIAKLADKLDQSFLIDTGSDRSIVPQEVSLQLKAHVFQVKDKYFNLAGKVISSSLIKIPKICIGDIMLHDVWLGLDTPGAKVGQTPSIGRDLLNKFCLTLNPFTDSISWTLYPIDPAERLEDEIEALMSLGRYSEIIAKTPGGILQATKNRKLRMIRAKALFGLKRYEKCVQEATKCIQLGCPSEESYFLRANAEGKLNNQKAAVKDIFMVASMFPEDPFVQFRCGNCLSDISAYKEAIDRFSYALTLRSDINQIYEERAIVYQKQKEYELALADFNKAIELDSEDGNYYNNRGMIYDELSQHKSALADLNKAIHLDSHQANYYTNRAAVLKHLGEYKRACNDCDTAIELDPGGANNYSMRSWVRNASGKDFDKSIEDCNKAISIDHNFAAAYRNRALAYIGKGDLATVLLDLNRSLKLDSLSERAGKTYYVRASVYMRLGKKKLADQDTKKSRELGYNPDKD